MFQSQADKTMVTEQLGDRKEAQRMVPLFQSRAGKTMVTKQPGDGKEVPREAPHQKFERHSLSGHLEHVCTPLPGGTRQFP